MISKYKFFINSISILFLFYFGLFMAITQLFAFLGYPKGTFPIRSVFSLVLLLFLFFASTNNFRIKKRLLKLTSFDIFIYILLIESIILFFMFHLPVIYILFTIYDSWIIVFIILLMMLSIDKIDIKGKYFNNIYRIFIYLFIPIFLLAVAQFIANQPILPISRANFIIDGDIRVYSFFNSPKSLGEFFIIFFYFNVIKIELTKNYYKKFLYFLFIICSLFIIYTTKVRGVYILFLGSFFFYFSMLFFSKFLNLKKNLKLHYSLSISLIVGIVVSISLIINLNLGKGLLNVNSLIDRLHYWGILFSTLDITTFHNIFGFGLIQNDGSLDRVTSIFGNNIYIMDNTYLQIYFWGGFVMLFSFFYIYFKINSVLVKYYSLPLNKLEKKIIIIILSISLAMLFLFLVSRALFEYFVIVYLPSLILIKYLEGKYKCKMK